jgi:hypothetical protein
VWNTVETFSPCKHHILMPKSNHWWPFLIIARKDGSFIVPLVSSAKER